MDRKGGYYNRRKKAHRFKEIRTAPLKELFLFEYLVI